MRRFLLNYLELSVICVALYSCSNHSQISDKEKPTYKKKNFDSLMNVVEKGMPGLEWYGALIANKAFVEIYEHSSSYFEDVKKLLSKEQFTQDQAVICVFSIQKLNINDYVELCRIYTELYDQHKISENTLELIIIRDFLKKRVIADNYTNPKVIALLNTLNNDKMISKNFKAMIEDILSGKFYNDTGFRN